MRNVGSQTKTAAQELAEVLQLSVAQVRAMQGRTAPILSLDTPMADRQVQLRNLLAERTGHDPLDTAVDTALRDHVRSGMQALTPREVFVVRARFGLDTGEGHTLEEIGQALQLSRERVRQLEARGLEKLRRAASPRRRRSVLER